MNLAFKSGNGTLVLVLGKTARKWFYGPGARAMLEHELAVQEMVSRCSVWARHAVPVRLGHFRNAISIAGHSVGAGAGPELETFVIDRVRDALHAGNRLPASELSPTSELQDVLRGAGAGNLFTQVRAVLAEMSLPTGPTHGDLHRGNILRVGEELRAIDFDRFRPNGCPLFDLLHFYLSEAQRGTGKRWLDLLCERPDLVERSTLKMVGVETLFISYSLQRIGHEGYVAGLKGVPLGKYARQTECALNHRQLIYLLGRKRK